MSAHGDPFRDIVKQLAHLYRANEEELDYIERVKVPAYQQWKRESDAYHNARCAFELTLRLKQNEKVVDGKPKKQ